MSDLSQYDYTLPKHLVAQHPQVRRSDARLLVVSRSSGRIQHRHVRDLPQLLSPRDCLILNDTKVVAARLVGQRKATGGRWEGLFLKSEASGHWWLLCKTRGKLSPGEIVLVESADGHPDLELTLIRQWPEGGWLARPTSGESSFGLLEKYGRVPLPRYIRGSEMVDTDRMRYQTVFAREPGAVAAPTAGLHFTEPLLDELRGMGVAVLFVTLHVGLGTFRPIETDTLDEHCMHSETGRISADTVETIRSRRAQGGRIVAVGTTSVRVLETASTSGELIPWEGDTNLFIRPPHRFQSVDALMTNFHLPRTSLLVLVHAFAGHDLARRAYAAAVEEEYRFYSYGDAMLIL